MKRYLVFAMVLALLSLGLPLAVAQEAQPNQPTDALVVTDVFPAQGSVADNNSEIVVFFNRPVVPLVLSVDQNSLPQPITITPSVQGTGKWLNTSIYQFTPSQPLAVGAKYTVTVLKDTLTAVDGSQLAEDFVSQFSTAQPSIVEQYPSPDAVGVLLGDNVQVRFSAVMDPALVESAFSLRTFGANSQTVSGEFTWSADNQGFQFAPSENLQLNTTYIVELNESVELENTNNTWYFTTVGEPSIVSTYPYDGQTGISPYGGFTIYFASPMDAKTIPDLINIDPKPEREPDMYYSEWDYSYVVSFEMYPSTTYTVSLGAGMKDIYGNTITNSLTFTFTTSAYDASVVMRVPGSVGFYNAYRDPTALYVTHRNISALNMSLYSVPLDNFVATVSGDYYYDPASDYVPSDDELIKNWTIPSVAPENAYRFEFLRLADRENLSCPGAMASQVAIGDSAIVITEPDPLRARDNVPDGEIVDLLYKGYTLTIAGGPQCDSGILWWQVRLRDGRLAWVAEGADNEYYLAPNNETTTAITPTPDGSKLPAGLYYLSVQAPELSEVGYSPQTHLLVVATANLAVKTSLDGMLIWATDVQTGEPLVNAPIRIIDGNTLQTVAEGTTQTDGLAEISLPKATDLYKRYVAVLDDGQNFGVGMTEWTYGIEPYEFGQSSDYYPRNYRLYLYTDRPLYRPNQPVYFKGIVRQKNDVNYTLPKLTTIPVTITDYNGEIVYEKDVQLTPFGTFSDSFTLAPDAGLGYYYVDARLPSELEYYSEGGSVSFGVAEYRLPEFQVSVTPSKDEVVQSDTFSVTVDSKYFFGGAVTNATVNYAVASAPYYFQYTGDNYYDFYDYDYDAGRGGYGGGSYGTIANGSVISDSQGMITFDVPADLLDKTIGATFTIEATVNDESNQSVSGRADVVVHKGLVYVGARPLKYVNNAEQPMTLEMIAVDWDSQPIANQSVAVRIVERRWSSVQEQDESGATTWTWEVEEIPVQDTVNLTTGDNGTVQFEFIPPTAGTYKAYVTTVDANGNEVLSSTQFWVSGSEYVSWRQQNSNRIDLISDKDSYQVGDTAEILITSPFQGTAEALVTIERSGVMSYEHITMTTNSTVYKLPITADFAPNVFVSVFMVKGVDENNPVASFRMGYVQLAVDISQKEITLDISSDVDTASPQQTVTYTIKATDYAGNPLQAEIGVKVTDLAALSLVPDDTPSLLQFFYGQQYLSVRTSSVLTINADKLTQEIIDTFKGGGGGGGGGGVPEVRGQFVDTPFWNAVVTTNAEGLATFEVKLPDNLTTWRLDARAITLAENGNLLVGQNTFDLKSTKPLIIRPITPRFFVVGDQATLGAVVNNNTDATQTVVVTIDATGVTYLDDNRSQTIEIPAGERGRVSWNVLVDSTKTVVATFIADGGAFSDATISSVSLDDKGTLPVYQYEVPETVGTASALLDAGTNTEAILLPDSDQGTVDIKLDYSLAGVSLDSLRALKEQGYDCIECTISLFLPNIISYNALVQSGLSNDTLKQELELNVNFALQQLVAEQKIDGGWGWDYYSQSDAVTTAYALIGLSVAKQQGFAVSDNMILSAQNFLRTTFITPDLKRENWELNRQAFTLYALARSGGADVGRTTALFEQYQRLSLYAQGFLAQTLFLINPNDTPRLDALANELINAAIPSATGVFWEESNRDYYNWNTNTRTTAIVLQTLLQLRPDNALLPNAVRHLLVQRKADFWETTQETAWSIMALTDWLVATNELKADFAYTVQINDQTQVEEAVNPQNVLEGNALQISVADLLRGNLNKLAITRTAGTGALYYTAFLNGYLPVAEVDAYANGIYVSRIYTLLGSETPITQAKVGDVVQVRLTIVVPNSLYYAVIEDPLPAGAEGINPNLAVSQQIGTRPELNLEDPLRYGWGWWYFSNIEFRDEKVVLSSTYLPSGTYEYVYTMRPSIEGVYNVIPATAREFYFPDVYGRSDGSTFTVLPADQ